MRERRPPSIRELLSREGGDEVSAPVLIYVLGLFGVLLLAHLLAS